MFKNNIYYAHAGATDGIPLSRTSQRATIEKRIHEQLIDNCITHKEFCQMFESLDVSTYNAQGVIVSKVWRDGEPSQTYLGWRHRMYNRLSYFLGGCAITTALLWKILIKK